MSLRLRLTFGPLEEGDKRCTRGDTCEGGRDPWDEQWEDSGLEFLGVGLGLTSLEPYVAAPEETSETREACDPGAD